MTGAHPSVHGALFNNMDTDTGLPAVAEVFGAAGYRTGHVGKWHLYPQGEHFGFDTVLAQNGYQEYLREHGLDPALGEEYPQDWERDFATWVQRWTAVLSLAVV